MARPSIEALTYTRDSPRHAASWGRESPRLGVTGSALRLTAATNPQKEHIVIFGTVSIPAIMRQWMREVFGF